MKNWSIFKWFQKIKYLLPNLEAEFHYSGEQTHPTFQNMDTRLVIHQESNCDASV